VTGTLRITQFPLLRPTCGPRRSTHALTIRLGRVMPEPWKGRERHLPTLRSISGGNAPLFPVFRTFNPRERKGFHNLPLCNLWQRPQLSITERCATPVTCARAGCLRDARLPTLGQSKSVCGCSNRHAVQQRCTQTFDIPSHCRLPRCPVLRTPQVAAYVTRLPHTGCMLSTASNRFIATPSPGRRCRAS
jgi:hypothetical protein